MAATDTDINFLIADLTRLCRQGMTGSAFIIAQHRLRGQICLEQGRIVFVSLEGKRGLEGFAALTGIARGQLRFEQNVLPAFRDSLPPTEELLRSLEGPKPPDKKPEKPAFPLAMAEEGTRVRIVELRASRKLDQRIAELALAVGTELAVQQRQSGSGLVVLRGDTRLALSGGMAHRIMVTPA